jgi:pyruvate/2-oxoglutarate dehydrogenase complex dihydrolipoamide acyltransferase (E2) component
MSRVPLAVLVGRAIDRAMVVKGRVEARSVFELSVRPDHRFVDGWQAGALVRSRREYFADPAASD